MLRELKLGGIRVHLDARDGIKPGAKYYEWEGRGVPLRLEIGPRDVAAGIGDAGPAHRREEDAVPDSAGSPHSLRIEMDAMQQDLLEAARTRREQNSIRGVTKAAFLDFLGARRRVRLRRLVRRCRSARPTSRNRPRRRSAACRTRSSAPRRRRQPACGAAARPWRRRCGRGRTEGGRADGRTGGPCGGGWPVASACSPTRASPVGSHRCYLGGVPLSATSPRGVGTPAYVYNAEVIRRQYQRA